MFYTIDVHIKIYYYNIIYCCVRNAFEHTRVHVTHPRAHFRTRDTCTHSRYNRTYGNQ